MLIANRVCVPDHFVISWEWRRKGGANTSKQELMHQKVSSSRLTLSFLSFWHIKPCTARVLERFLNEEETWLNWCMRELGSTDMLHMRGTLSRLRISREDDRCNTEWAVLDGSSNLTFPEVELARVRTTECIDGHLQVNMYAPGVQD